MAAFKRQGVEKSANEGSTKSQRLVATRVASLGPGTYTDPGQTGLQLRVYRKRTGFTRTWLLRFKFRGEETRIALGHFPDTSLDAARALARKYREAAAQGIDPRRARPKRRQAPAIPAMSGPIGEHTIENLALEFMERHIRGKRKRPEYVQRILNRDVLPVWSGRDARSIEPHEVIELLDRIVDRGAPIGANRVAAVLTQLFKFGIHRRIVPSSPVQLLYRPGGKEKPKNRALSAAELAAFLSDPKGATRFERLSHILTILLLTGQRRGELGLARWAEIDLKEKRWLIPAENSKTGKEHVVPLTDWAVHEFESLKALAKDSRFVVPSDTGDAAADPKLITRGVARCQERMRKLGISKFSAHDLRRTVRTGLARLKIPPHIAERVLNHAQEKIPGTYDLHDYLEEKRDALEKWAAHLEDLRFPMTRVDSLRIPGDSTQTQTAATAERLDSTMAREMCFPDTHTIRTQMFAYMAFPEDEQMRACFRVTDLAWRAGKFGHEAILSPNELKLLSDGPGYRRICDRMRKNGSQGGVHCGETLLMMLRLKVSGIEPSFSKARHLLLHFFGKAKDKTGHKVANNEESLRAAWLSYRAVAHLWAAHQIYHQNLGRTEAERLLNSGEGTVKFLGVARALQAMASSIHVPGHGDLLNPTLTWSIPNYICTCEVELKPLQESETATLDSYKRKMR